LDLAGIAGKGRKNLMESFRMAGLEILTVKTRSDIGNFIDLPWEIYKDNSLWAPPLKSHMRRLLNPSKHPFWKFSERELYLARRGSETVGRIAAIVDGNHNQYHNEKMGVWGFFECRNDFEAAAELFKAVESWAREKGMTFLRGPLNPSMNYECGMLIEGFEQAPTIMMPYNPPYYMELIDSNGFEKEKDLITLWFNEWDQPSARLQRLARRLKRNNRMTIRPLNLKNLNEEIKLFNSIFNECWAENWGFVPMTDEEMRESVKDLPKIADPDLIYFTYYDDDPAGVAMILPDATPLLRRLNGRLGPIGLIKLALHRKEIRGLRGIVWGYKKRYQRLGAALMAWDHGYRKFREKGYKYCELGWNLEDNRGINRLDTEIGGTINKRYRIYRKDL
jgi:hypothetical protein